MAGKWYNFQGDPVNSDTVSEYIHAVSTTKYSAGGDKIEFDDITAPGSANYPLNTPTRYFIELPGTIDQSDLAGTRPITLTHSVAGNLTPVAGAPAAGEYQLPTVGSARGNMVFVNATEGATGTFSFDMYLEDTIPNASDLNTLYVDSSSMESYVRVKEKIIEIGAWDMNFGVGGDQDLVKAHGISGMPANLLGISAIIIADGGSSYVDWGDFSSSSVAGPWTYVDSTNVELRQPANSPYNGASYNDTGINRGFIIIKYKSE